jgi:hypothetical protein
LFRDVPPVKNRGLADVIGALPAAQIADGVDARVLLPAFPDIRRGIPDAQVVTRRDTFAGRITLLFGHFNGVGIYLIDAPHLYDRPGSPYHDTNLAGDSYLRTLLVQGLVQCLLAPGKGLTHSAVGFVCWLSAEGTGGLLWPSPPKMRGCVGHHYITVMISGCTQSTKARSCITI